MDIIVSHHLTDLDGLGAMVAANKLYPAAKAVLVGRLHRTVKDFMVLYKDEIKTYTPAEINLEKVQRVIMVDTSRREMIGELSREIDWEKCQVVVYDHHLHEKEDWIDLDMSENLGSATTILVNKIVAEDLKLNPFEATVCALAIYADTGNLTHLNTTSSDVRALAYLLEAGANLKIINDFIKEPLNKKQEKLLEELIKNRFDINIDGISVSLFPISYNQYIPGLNRVVEQIKRLYHLSNIFILFTSGKTVQVIGRSSDEAVDVGRICTSLGGGGHSGAAAARMQDYSLEEAKEKLVSEISKNVQPSVRIREIMSSPVRTIAPDASIEEVEEMMKKYGHNGFIVVKGDKLVGIFSRRDLSKVKGHNLMHAPVRAYMTKDLITIDVNAPVSRAQELMVENGVGRLPVLEGEKLVGIVTRSNLLAAYYGGDTLSKHKHRYGSSMINISKSKRFISDRLEKLPEEIILVLKKAGQFAEKNGVRAYLIGGMVRDILLNEEIGDLDIVIDGSLENFITQLAAEFKTEYSYNRKFRTGSILMPTGLNIDLASARREIYQYTGALPEVEASDILEDLFRRDYTINVLAVCLNPDKWGQLLDYFNGEADLNNAHLRILHRFSFLDDPTRIIRGIRLAVKLGFKFEMETSSLIKEAISTADFSRLSVERVFKELELLFDNKISDYLFTLLKEYSIFNLLNLDIEIKEEMLFEARSLENFLAEYQEKNYNIEDWILRIAVFTDKLTMLDIEKWNIKNSHKDILSAYNKYKGLLKKLDNNLNGFEIFNKLSNLSNGELIILLVKAKGELAKKNILKYLDQLQDLEIEINGNDLKELGIQPGPQMKDILDQLFTERLMGNIIGQEEQLAYAKKLITKFK